MFEKNEIFRGQHTYFLSTVPLYYSKEREVRIMKGKGVRAQGESFGTLRYVVVWTSHSQRTE